MAELSKEEIFMVTMEVALKVKPNEKQREFYRDFQTPTICFASPGTGKTAATVWGLIKAETYNQINGRNIYVISFTNNAVGEIAVRHRAACQACGGIEQRVNFSTLHSLCTQILMKNYRLLGMDELKIQNSEDIQSISSMMQKIAENDKINLGDWESVAFVRAYNKLNSALVFDKENLETRMDYISLGLDYDSFQHLRSKLYYFYKMSGYISKSDILLYTLELLLQHPEVAEEFREQCKLLVVDEAQDLSLLQLRLISLLSKSVVIIGDMKQQIYEFNGACPEVVSQFMTYFPNARKLELTQSYRCSNTIAQYANGLIRANRYPDSDFQGIGIPGIVDITDKFNSHNICEDIAMKYRANGKRFDKSVMFLFRNNFSAIPIVEELFQLDLPVRSPKYPGAHTVPVVKDLLEVVTLCANPRTLSNASAFLFLVPEFKKYDSAMKIPIYKRAQKTGCSLFDTDYEFHDADWGANVMEMLRRVQTMLSEGRLLKDLLNAIYPFYAEAWLRDHAKYLENTPQYYCNLVQSLAAKKTYFKFMEDEAKKMNKLEEYAKRQEGVRCYTFHSSKGLEADIVYILEAEDSIIPNQGRLKKAKEKDCLIECARTIRNERSLVYVACTRAKEELHIIYSEVLSSLLTPRNFYQQYDDAYFATKRVFNDVEIFTRFFTGEWLK